MARLDRIRFRMSNNYRTLTDADSLRRSFGVPSPEGSWKPDVYLAWISTHWSLAKQRVL
jgi:hypothetical protein